MATRSPPDGEYTRRSDPQNKKLPPSIRAINYAKAAATGMPAIIALIGALGYTNADHIKQWTGIAAPSGKVEGISAEEKPFEQRVSEYTNKVAAELEAIRADAAELRSQVDAKDTTNYTKLTAELKRLDARLKKIEKIVQN